MKKILLFLLVMFILTTCFSYTLGIKGSLINPGFQGFEMAIKVTEVFNNSLADAFLRTNDLIIAVSSISSLGPTNQSTSRRSVEGSYINNTTSYKSSAITGVDYFKNAISTLEDSSVILNFLIYRNGRYIEYTVF